LLVEVDQHNFVRHALQRHGVCCGAANKPAADDADFHALLPQQAKTARELSLPGCVLKTVFLVATRGLACPPLTMLLVAEAGTRGRVRLRLIQETYQLLAPARLLQLADSF